MKLLVEMGLFHENEVAERTFYFAPATYIPHEVHLSRRQSARRNREHIGSITADAPRYLAEELWATDWLKDLRFRQYTIPNTGRWCTGLTLTTPNLGWSGVKMQLVVGKIEAAVGESFDHNTTRTGSIKPIEQDPVASWINQCNLAWLLDAPFDAIAT